MVLFNSNYKELGDLKQNLVLLTLGKIKIRYGNKFIDLLDSKGNLAISESFKLPPELIKLISEVTSYEDYLDTNLLIEAYINYLISSKNTNDGNHISNLLNLLTKLRTLQSTESSDVQLLLEALNEIKQTIEDNERVISEAFIDLDNRKIEVSDIPEMEPIDGNDIASLN